MVVAVVRLLMLLLLMMMGMLLMMLVRLCGTSGTTVQPPIPGVTRSLGAAVTSRPVNGSWRAGWCNVEGAGGHREALMLIQRMVMMQMMVVVVSGFRRRISAGPRSVTN